MGEKLKNKYRIKSNRADWWDYRNAGGYFITICTKNRFYYFGEIKNGEMNLSEVGKVVEEEWQKTLIVRKDMNLLLEEFIVMPSHWRKCFQPKK